MLCLPSSPGLSYKGRSHSLQHHSLLGYTQLPTSALNLSREVSVACPKFSLAREGLFSSGWAPFSLAGCWNTAVLDHPAEERPTFMELIAPWAVFPPQLHPYSIQYCPLTHPARQRGLGSPLYLFICPPHSQGCQRAPPQPTAVSSQILQFVRLPTHCIPRDSLQP